MTRSPGGLRIAYDTYGVPHIYGNTRDDLSFGSGWVTARDRGLLLSLGRGPARVAVADVPGIDAFWLVTSGKGFAPSKQAEALVDQAEEPAGQDRTAPRGAQILKDSQAYIDGANAYQRCKGLAADYTVNDVIATTAFIGSIFGAGGGGEAQNSELLGALRKRFGNKRGTGAFKDVMLADDPEAPTTIEKTFKYGPNTGGKVKGSVVVDAGSLKPFDPLKASKSGGQDQRAGRTGTAAGVELLITASSRSATGKTLAVMGPQLGYYYPRSCSRCTSQAQAPTPRAPSCPAWRCTCCWAGPATTPGA